MRLGSLIAAGKSPGSGVDAVPLRSVTVKGSASSGMGVVPLPGPLL